MICPKCGIEIHGSFEIHGYCHNCGYDLVPPSRPLSHPPDAFATNDDFLEQFVNMAGARGYFASRGKFTVVTSRKHCNSRVFHGLCAFAIENGYHLKADFTRKTILFRLHRVLVPLQESR